MKFKVQVNVFVDGKEYVGSKSNALSEEDLKLFEKTLIETISDSDVAYISFNLQNGGMLVLLRDCLKRAHYIFEYFEEADD